MSTPRSVLFVIAEDWFFASHFLPIASLVQRNGYTVSVLLRVNDPDLRRRIEAAGIRVLDTASFRDRQGLFGCLAQIRRIHAVLRREQPAIVHLISLRMIVIGGLAAMWAGIPVRVQSLTGLGLLGASKGLRARAILVALGWCLKYVLGGRRAAYIFENRQDPEWLGIDPQGPKALVVGGAGIDPTIDIAMPLPSAPPLRIAMVARMIYSKGVTVAVEGIALARAAGADVTLTLVGTPDLGNPRSLSETDLRALADRPGITWVGRTNDVHAVWRDHHVVCVPSIGGEGLPRSLLEGAAAARPIVTTATPGCATFVRDGVEGLVVPPGDAAALARAFVWLFENPRAIARMGTAARNRVLDGFTIQQVAEATTRLYGQCLQTGQVDGIGRREASRQKARG
ncbi:glycosyltransferase [Lichenifustis flavocetrariae]|uniref:Glycosyltransferase n=1 Tax=Lichenifustis flavocetrariae TaxID=2949735 RepID=A0AA42CL38_9HYPH|nr:glycosyltransferase [Lichenifustis flavocetrariae]MCW6506992.1 glycosyltransferase [Lichenifustis flavocetrariae]